MLQFDWEIVEGTPVSGVLAKQARQISDGALVCDEVAVVLGERTVVLKVNADTDEVSVALGNASATHTEWQTIEQLGDMIGRHLGWCWIGRNYRGYLDTFTIALDGMDAAYSFTGVASALHCARVSPILA